MTSARGTRARSSTRSRSGKGAVCARSCTTAAHAVLLSTWRHTHRDRAGEIRRAARRSAQKAARSPVGRQMPGAERGRPTRHHPSDQMPRSAPRDREVNYLCGKYERRSHPDRGSAPGRERCGRSRACGAHGHGRQPRTRQSDRRGQQAVGNVHPSTSVPVSCSTKLDDRAMRPSGLLADHAQRRASVALRIFAIWSP